MTTPNNDTALLVMDVQQGILDRLPNGDAYVATVRAAVDAAHARHIPVIHVVVGFRAGMPEVSKRNKSFSALQTGAYPGLIDPKPAITPTGDDIVVTKRRVSAFAGSDLEVLLRGREIGHLVLTGIATSGVVLSTLREAADKDFEITVLSDLCLDFDAEVHQVLVEKVFPRQANVITSQEWMA
ncbi:MAG TPA: isochorismatase family cysteine hydrolase [Gemmatimonadaceae bacterium]|jgi:nicotinamidase-related amidase